MIQHAAGKNRMVNFRGPNRGNFFGGRIIPIGPFYHSNGLINASENGNFSHMAKVRRTIGLKK
jgi:hypothetical protein